VQQLQLRALAWGKLLRIDRLALAQQSMPLLLGLMGQAAAAQVVTQVSQFGGRTGTHPLLAPAEELLTALKPQPRRCQVNRLGIAMHKGCPVDKGQAFLFIEQQ